MLNTGEYEVLGAWPRGCLGGRDADLVSHDLIQRGMEHVGVLINVDSDDLSAAILRNWPGTAAVSSFSAAAQLALSAASPRSRQAVSMGLARVRRAPSQQLAHAVLDVLEATTWRSSPEAAQTCRAAIGRWRAVYSLSRRARERVRQGEDAAWLLQQGVARALAQHGPFESAPAAAAFAQAWLVIAERRLRHGRPLRPVMLLSQ